MTKMDAAAISKAVTSARQVFQTGRTKAIQWRMSQLKALYSMLETYESDICEALRKDLGRHPKESYAFEILGVKNDIATLLKRLPDLVKPERVPGHGIMNIFDRCEVRRQPYGVVLIISPWNYPLLLLLQPAVEALAAGNCLILKPSEMSPATTELLARILPISCDPEAIQIITGGPRQAELLLEQKFDYIFFTGGSRVGQVVALAAAKFLTPVTLELGGKSPCIVDQNVDPDVVAKRIAWAKFVNAGQTCIAPDYVLVHHKVATAFVASLQKAIKELYGLEPKTNSHYARIINASNLKRLQGVLQHQLASNPDTVVYGGAIDEKDRYIEPTIVAFVGKDPIANPIMAEEIFGPLLPIIEVQDVDEALRYVNSRGHPLALYTFSQDAKVNEKVLEETMSGNAMVNDLFLAMTVDSLPFGGVGPSGHGGYHGVNGFELFSHKRSVMHRPAGLEALLAIRYPPIGYTERGFYFLKKFMDSFRPRL